MSDPSHTPTPTPLPHHHRHWTHTYDDGRTEHRMHSHEDEKGETEEEENQEHEGTDEKSSSEDKQPSSAEFTHSRGKTSVEADSNSDAGAAHHEEEQLYDDEGEEELDQDQNDEGDEGDVNESNEADDNVAGEVAYDDDGDDAVEIGADEDDAEDVNEDEYVDEDDNEDDDEDVRDGYHPTDAADDENDGNNDDEGDEMENGSGEEENEDGDGDQENEEYVEGDYEDDEEDDSIENEYNYHQFQSHRRPISAAVKTSKDEAVDLTLSDEEEEDEKKPAPKKVELEKRSSISASPAIASSSQPSSTASSSATAALPSSFLSSAVSSPPATSVFLPSQTIPAPAAIPMTSVFAAPTQSSVDHYSDGSQTNSSSMHIDAESPTPASPTYDNNEDADASNAAAPSTAFGYAFDPSAFRQKLKSKPSKAVFMSPKNRAAQKPDSPSSAAIATTLGLASASPHTSTSVAVPKVSFSFQSALASKPVESDFPSFLPIPPAAPAQATPQAQAPIKPASPSMSPMRSVETNVRNAQIRANASLHPRPSIKDQAALQRYEIKHARYGDYASMVLDLPFCNNSLVPNVNMPRTATSGSASSKFPSAFRLKMLQWNARENQRVANQMRSALARQQTRLQEASLIDRKRMDRHLFSCNSIEQRFKQAEKAIDSEIDIIKDLGKLSLTPGVNASNWRQQTVTVQNEFVSKDIDYRIWVEKIAPMSIVQQILQEILDEAKQDLVKEAVADGKRCCLLSPSDMSKTEQLLSTPAKQVVTEKFNIDISGTDLNKLRNLNWLSDQSLNFYMEMLGDRQKRNQASTNLVLPTQKWKIHYFNTFFYKKLSPDERSYVYKDVGRWLKRAKVDIATLDKIILPVHVGGNHWCLAIINLHEKQFEYYDSLGGSNDACLTNLKKYVTDEYKAQHADKVEQLHIDEWPEIHCKSIPRQQNASDCGVFTIKFADYQSENRPFNFSQNDMPYFRRRIALEISLGRVL